ncbi:glycosyltransferase family A protein, partial [Escherichia coli]
LLALESVLFQKAHVNTIIIVDDNSSFTKDDFFDKAKKIIENDNTDIIFHKNDKNYGACYCRNLGANLSKAELIAFLDDDDSWDPNHLNSLVDCFHEHVVLAYSGKNIINYQTGKIRRSLSKIQDDNQYEQMLRKNYPGSTSSILVKKSALMAVNGFDVSLPAIQDYDFYLRICRLGLLKSSGMYTLNYRNDTPLKITNQLQKARAAYNIIIQKYHGRERMILNRTIYKQNIIKCIRYFDFIYLFKFTRDFINFIVEWR